MAVEKAPSAMSQQQSLVQAAGRSRMAPLTGKYGPQTSSALLHQPDNLSIFDAATSDEHHQYDRDVIAGVSFGLSAGGSRVIQQGEDNRI